MGATGFLGVAVCRLLEERKFNFLKISMSTGCDLKSYDELNSVFKGNEISNVINCAAFVGGIQFGLRREADIFHNNMQIITNVLKCCSEANLINLINPISNCAYPGSATLFRESEFWDGRLHSSVEVYGMCRKMLVVASNAYNRQFGLNSVNLVLSNMYGPGDHFEEERSHAFGALIMKIVKAKRDQLEYVDIWGTGTPVREWLHVRDGAQALVRSLDLTDHHDLVNIGSGKGISIIDLASQIAKEIGYTGKLKIDPTREDGAPYKTVEGSAGAKLLDWSPKIDISDGIRDTVSWYLNNIEQNK